MLAAAPKKEASTRNARYIEQVMALFEETYGRDVFHMMPKGYRDESHKKPDAHFLKHLSKFTRLKTADPMPLGDLRCALFQAARHRLLTVIDAPGGKYIIKSDIKHAIEVREIAEAESGDEGEDGVAVAGVKVSHPPLPL